VASRAITSGGDILSRPPIGIVCLLGIAASCTQAQTIERQPSAWYEALRSQFHNPSLRVQVGTGRFGPVIAAVFGDSMAVSRPWVEQQQLAKVVARYILAHVDSAPPLGVVNVGYELPHFAGPNVLRIFRFFPPAKGDTLADALAPE
jgi:hypothetical protein